MILLHVASLLIILQIDGSVNSERVRLEAKKLIKGKVVASGISIPAKSLSHCLGHCNLRKKSCDGIVYYEIIQKCRLINKCAPTYQVDNSSDIVYYSKRPRIMTSGYQYDAESDSCLGLVNVKGTYAQADEFCRKLNARVALIDRKKLNKIASQLLLMSGVKWAWINNKNFLYEVNNKSYGIPGNEILSDDMFSPEIVQWQNNSFRSCWGLNDRGQWGQYSCKNSVMMALCQVQKFIV